MDNAENDVLDQTIAPSISAMDHYALLKTTQRKQGIGRIKLGALLCVLKEHDGWKGRAGNTFRQFLVEEGIEPKAAHQYMQVAKCFVLDYRISLNELDKIASASMRNLCLAASIATSDNLLTILTILGSLPKAEASEELHKLVPQLGAKKVPSAVNRILNQMTELTLDEKAEFFQKIGNQKQKTIDISNTVNYKYET